MVNPIPETVSVTLSESQRELIAAQVAAGRVSNATDYVRELLEADEQAKELAEIEAKLLHAIDANKWVEMGPNLERDLLQRVTNRLAREQQ